MAQFVHGPSTLPCVLQPSPVALQSLTQGNYCMDGPLLCCVLLGTVTTKQTADSLQRTFFQVLSICSGLSPGLQIPQGYRVTRQHVTRISSSLTFQSVGRKKISQKGMPQASCLRHPGGDTEVKTCGSTQRTDLRFAIQPVRLSEWPWASHPPTQSLGSHSKKKKQQPSHILPGRT